MALIAWGRRVPAAVRATQPRWQPLRGRRGLVRVRRRGDVLRAVAGTCLTAALASGAGWWSVEQVRTVDPWEVAVSWTDTHLAYWMQQLSPPATAAAADTALVLHDSVAAAPRAVAPAGDGAVVDFAAEPGQVVP